MKNKSQLAQCGFSLWSQSDSGCSILNQLSGFYWISQRARTKSQSSISEETTIWTNFLSSLYGRKFLILVLTQLGKKAD